MLRFTRPLLIPALMLAALFTSCDKNPDGGDNITFSKNSFPFDSKAQHTTCTITSPFDWTLEPDNSWITVDSEFKKGSSGKTTITFSVTENNEGKNRNGSITVSGVGVSKTYVLTVKQAAKNEVNDWIYEQLSSTYYWNAAVKAATPNYNLEYDKFLENLLLNLVDAKDADGTMDGGYNAKNEHRLYSFISRTAATRADGESETFGFGFEALWANKEQTRLIFIVTWIQPDGPAQTAGLKRGMIINRYQDGEITYKAYESFFDQIYNLEGSGQMKLGTTAGGTFTVSAKTMEVSPVIYSSVVTTTGNKKVGYLVYNDFERGASVGGGKYKFDNQVREAFQTFKSAGGVTELVLDLRYNPGGYVTCCQILSSLIASTSTSDVFAKLQYNSSITQNNPYVMHYLNESSSFAGLSKVYILATGGSASASEMVISSLRGIKGENFVVHIGEVTEGKNVGMDLYTETFGGYEYEMWPITFKIKNALDFSDYADGFTPNHNLRELREITREGGSGIIYELGDKKEELLKAALTLIDDGTPTVDPLTRSTEELGKVKQPRLKTPRGGAKIIPSEMEGMQR